MSELNRMLSDLSSPESNPNRVAPVAIPSVWGFRFARVALALVATLVGATGISWAWVSGDHKTDVASAQLLPTKQNVAMDESTSAMIPTPNVHSSMPSPTQKVATREMRFVEAKAPEVVASPTGIAMGIETVATQIIEPALLEREPVLIAQVQTAPVKAAPVEAAPVKAAPMKDAPTKIAAVSEPKPVVPVQEQSASSAVTPESSLTVETIELSGEELAAIAYDKAQKRAQVGDTKKATSYLRDAVKYDANHVAATNQLAGLLYGRNQLRDAESVLRKGISANPSSASLKLTLARMYQQSQREESALNVLMAPASVLDSDQVRYVSLRASLAQKLGKHDVANQSYQWLAEREPLDGRWWLGLGISAERQKDYANAERGYGKAITAGGLSNESVQFARQRLAYLQSQPQQGADNGR
ncbi:tetratricopeptide repeat protein [Enterovibrio calviensis]|uniref:tetratricopeptide repeat protein n=1 Tax=Enterovibrio calviensis TaxID=91359 RepID=UPI00048394BC|nr:tetratricopeptide repeat protein [Enterovibrio calviensis]